MFFNKKYLLFVWSYFFFFSMLPSIVIANDPFEQMNKSINTLGLKIACEEFDFNQKEIEVCMKVYPSCMSPDLRPSEQKKCVIDSVARGKISSTSNLKETKTENQRNPFPSEGPKLSFLLTPAQAYDLIQMCNHSDFNNNSICSGAILPNKSRIMSDLNSTIK